MAEPPGVPPLADALLHGPDVVEPGQVALAAPAPGLFAALSPGRWPKRPAPVDPNEDGVLVAAGAGRVVLVVVDAHFGYASGAAALSSLHSAAGELLGSPADVLGRRLSALLERASDAVAAAVRLQPDSATALSVAVVDRRRLLAATYGDTVVLRVTRRGRVRQVGRSRGFVGAQAPRPVVDQVRLRATDRVLLASDGLTDYLGSAWLQRIGEHVAAAPGETAVRALVEEALAAGAGDHVAVALWSPPA